MIFHIDIDCFYAAAERIKNPKLKNIPIAVGGRSDLKLFDSTPSNINLMDTNTGAFVAPVFHRDENLTFNSMFVEGKKVRGVVVTSSYEARAKGVKTGMSVKEALSFCPNLTIIPPDHLYYHDLSHRLFILLCTLMPNIEQFSIDEFFCDISGMKEAKNPKTFALSIKEKIKKELNLPVSIGICKAKWIAKLATNDAKPDGVLYVKEENILTYIEKKPVKDFPGIGKGYEKRLFQRGITTLGECARVKHIFESWKLPGTQLYKRIVGIDGESTQRESKRKSIGISRTFDPIRDRDELQRRVTILCRHIAFMTCKLGVNPSSFYIKIRYEYREKSVGRHTEYRLFSEKRLREIMIELFNKTDIYKNSGVIHLAMSVGSFIEYSKKSVSLLDFDEDKEEQKLTNATQKIRKKYGLSAIRSANELNWKI